MNSVWKDGRPLAAHSGLATQQQPWPPPEDTATWLLAVKKQACTYMYILVSNYQEKKKKTAVMEPRSLQDSLTQGFPPKG